MRLARDGSHNDSPSLRMSCGRCCVFVTVASGSHDRTIRLWVVAGRQLRTVRHLDACVMTLAIRDREIFAGDAAGRIHRLQVNWS